MQFSVFNATSSSLLSILWSKSTFLADFAHKKGTFLYADKTRKLFLILRMHLCRQGWEDVYGYLYCCHTYLYFIVYLLLMSSL